MPLHLRSGQLNEAPKKLYHSSYQVFEKELRKQNPNISFQEFTSLLKQQWEQMSEDDLEKYEHQYQDYIISYNIELLKFYGHSKSDINNILKLKQREFSKPTQPVNAQLIFQHEVYNQVKIENPQLSQIDIRKVIQEMYLLLTENEKDYYQEQYNKERQKFELEQKAWKQIYQVNEVQEQQKYSVGLFKKQQQEKDDFLFQEYTKSKTQVKPKTKKMYETLPSNISQPQNDTQSKGKNIKYLQYQNEVATQGLPINKTRGRPPKKI